jgi:hypothetical protein
MKFDNPDVVYQGACNQEELRAKLDGSAIGSSKPLWIRRTPEDAAVASGQEWGKHQWPPMRREYKVV